MVIAGHLGGVVGGRQSWNCNSCLQEMKEVEVIHTAICTLNRSMMVGLPAPQGESNIL